MKKKVNSTTNALKEEKSSTKKMDEIIVPRKYLKI